MIIANYIHSSSITTVPAFNDGYTGYTVNKTDNGDGTSTTVIEHESAKPTSCKFIGKGGLLHVN